MRRASRTLSIGFPTSRRFAGSSDEPRRHASARQSTTCAGRWGARGSRRRSPLRTLSMSPELKALTAVSVAAAVTAVATPLMARVALLVGLLDRPVGYKQHARPTPYLGGVAILLGIVAAALLLMGTSSPIPVIVLGAAAMCALGTVDDWRPLPASVRLAIQTAIGIAIWAGEAGWATGLPSGIECLLTVGWVVLAANTFNLLDNLDGAASSVAAGSALGIVVIALATGGAVWAAVIAAGV